LFGSGKKPGLGLEWPGNTVSQAKPSVGRGPERPGQDHHLGKNFDAHAVPSSEEKPVASSDHYLVMDKPVLMVFLANDGLMPALYT